MCYNICNINDYRGLRPHDVALERIHAMAYLLYFIPALAFTLVFLKLFIDRISKTEFFRKKENVDSIKKPCISELHKHKAATPSMGGLAINLALLLSTAAYSIVSGRTLWIGFILLLFGIMGFADDYIKLKKIRDGVSPRQKLLGQAAIGAICVAYLYYAGQITAQTTIPFVGGAVAIALPAYLPLLVVLIVASSNSVNITDGLDGLALGINILALGFVIYYAHRVQDSDALFVAVVLEAACLAALFFNKHPAKIFMGDTGSLMLGGAVSVLLIKLGIPLFIPLVLIVCLFETVSVVIQVFSLKFFKKRVFKIAPFHHHLEKCGWKETKIVCIFWGITAIFCFLAYLGGRI